MAIDYGDARTGVAISDPTGLLAGYTTVIQSRKEGVVAEELARLAKEHSVDELVMGFPRNMEGVGCTDSLPDRQLCKKDIIRLLMERHALDPASMVMVGDTALDIRGGNEQGIATIAALYGYGDKAKLLAERPRYLTDDPEWRTLRKAE